MTTRLQGVLSSVLADPSSIRLRDEYAKAAKAAGLPHADLARAQVDGLMADQTDDWRARMRAFDRERSLATAINVQAWTPSSLRAGSVQRVVFRGGLVEEVVTDARWFLSQADAVFAESPVRHLDLFGVVPCLPELLKAPWLSRLLSLGLRGNGLTDDHVASLAAAPGLSGLRWLDLSSNALTTAAVETLAVFRGLEYVCLKKNGFDHHELQESYGVDGASGTVVEESISTSTWSRELETKAGRRLPWLHVHGILLRSEVDGCWRRDQDVSHVA